MGDIQPEYIFKVTGLLEKVARNEPTPEITDEVIELFGENCKDILREMQKGRDKGDGEFRLRFSNIGKDARSLWLEANYGRKPLDANTLLKMKYGHLIENLFIALLQSAVPNSITDIGKRVELDIDGATIKGTMDFKLNGVVIDAKSASTYAYDVKFNDLKSLETKDDFGYCGQGIGYGQADNSLFGGWLVIDKVTGAFKHVDATPLNTVGKIQETLRDFKYKLDVVNGVAPPPACTGVEEEVYNKKPTGRKVLGKKCQYCQHKEMCHPNVSYEPVKESRAKSPPWRHYVDN
jgi:hypothetical protein